MVVFDASLLMLILDDNAKASLPNARERVEYLINCLSKEGERIVIPTPALSECLVHAGPAGPGYLAILSKRAVFRIASFDERAAVGAAFRTWAARQPGDRQAKIKFDRQIVAIAKVEGATAVYADDGNVIAYAREAGMEGYLLADLPEPPACRVAGLQGWRHPKTKSSGGWPGLRGQCGRGASGRPRTVELSPLCFES